MTAPLTSKQCFFCRDGQRTGKYECPFCGEWLVPPELAEDESRSEDFDPYEAAGESRFGLSWWRFTMSDALTTDPRCAHGNNPELCIYQECNMSDLCQLADDVRRIADTVEQNGGWHIAAVKLREAADELERMRAGLRGVITAESHLAAIAIADRALKGKQWKDEP